MFKPKLQPDGGNGNRDQRRIFADQPGHGRQPNQAEEVVDAANRRVVQVQEHQRGGCAGNSDGDGEDHPENADALAGAGCPAPPAAAPAR